MTNKLTVFPIAPRSSAHIVPPFENLKTLRLMRMRAPRGNPNWARERREWLAQQPSLVDMLLARHK